MATAGKENVGDKKLHWVANPVLSQMLTEAGLTVAPALITHFQVWKCLTRLNGGFNTDHDLFGRLSEN